MKRLTLTVTLIAALLVVFLGPAALLSWRLRDGLRRDLRTRDVSVRVIAGPIGIAGGRLAQLGLNARDAAFDGLPLDEVSVDLRGVTLDRDQAFRGELVVRQIVSGTAGVTVREASLRRHLLTTRGLGEARVRMDDGEVTISGKVTVLGAPLDVVVRTRLVIQDPRHLALEVQGVRVGGFEVSADVGRAVGLSINPFLTAPQRPVPLRFTSVVVDDGAVHIAAEVAQ